MNEEVQLLREILTTLREIRDGARAGSPSAGGAPSSAGGTVAGDRELDSEWGNPIVRKDPRDWKGPSFVGCNFSECPPEYLDQLAGLFDWMADRDEEKGAVTKGKKPSAPYKRSDAARARGWAKRARDGWQAPAKSSDQEADRSSTDYGGTDAVDDIPF